MLRKLLTFLQSYCWCCGYHRNEWINWKVFIERRGKCFYCRMDALDIKHGPSEQATIYATLNKGVYMQPQLTRFEMSGIIRKTQKQLKQTDIA